MPNPNGNPAWVKGKSANPNGRPRKSQTMTDILTTALSKTVETEGGGKIARKRLLAELMAEAVTTGRVTFPGDDKPSQISVKDWSEIVKWIYERIDGKPIQPVTGADGGPIEIKDVSDVISKLLPDPPTE